MINSLKRQVEWLERTSNSLRSAANEPFDYDSDFQRGLNKGMLLAVKHYEKEIQELKQMLEGYMVDDVSLEGGDEEYELIG